MRLSVEWLNDHVDTSGVSVAELAERYTVHVAEVESVEAPADAWGGIVVGRVEGVRAHPGADRLRLVRVETGAGEVEVVCGAPNVAEGQSICFAPEGTTLPDGLVLKRRKIRGVESGGMVLSERELGLSDEHEGIVVLDEAHAPGTAVAAVLPAAAVIVVDNTAITTRPDLWGHYGAAREIAAVLERELRFLDLGEDFPTSPAQVEVEVESPELCPRYLGWVIGGIEVGPSPDWLRRRLEQAGQRPINNVVDLTNYILLECGQPLHAFDRRQIAGGRIVVRAAKPGERVTTLDGVERELPAAACVIADPERAVAIAGVMGLANSEVMADTTEIVLEVANFEMRSVRSTGQALGLRTESAVRFEKGLDPEGVEAAARRFLTLLQRVCPGAHALGAPCDVRVPPEPPRRITVGADWIPARLGTTIAPARVDSILGRLGFGTERDGATSLVVTVPSWRAGRDVSIPEDLLEEVGRIHGYDRIEPVPLRGDLQPVPVEPERGARRVVRDLLSGPVGLTEIHTYPFVTADACERSRVEPGRIGVANAADPGLALLTASLLPNLLRAVGLNLRYRSEVGIYVVAPVFLKEEGEEGLPRENERIAIAVSRREEGRAVYAVKGAAEALLESFGLEGVRVDQKEGPAWLHAGRCARLGRGPQTFGWFGQLHPAVARAWDVGIETAVADLDLDALRGAKGKPPRFQPVSRYPEVPYDVALVVDRRVAAAEIESVLSRVDKDLVRGVRLFDVYEGENLPEGKKSLAFTITFGSFTETLDGAVVERLRAAVGAAVEKRGWALRL